MGGNVLRLIGGRAQESYQGRLRSTGSN
jgi:hypothetical protein